MEVESLLTRRERFKYEGSELWKWLEHERIALRKERLFAREEGEYEVVCLQRELEGIQWRVKEAAVLLTIAHGREQRSVMLAEHQLRWNVPVSIS